MADEQIASGHIDISLNDRDALARLRALDKQFSRTMEDIDRQRATVTIDADTAKMDDEVTHAKREIKRLQGEKAEVQLGFREGSIKKYNSEIKKARVDLQRLDGEKAVIDIEVRSDQAQFKAAQKQVALLDKQQRAAHDAQMRRVATETRVSKSLNDQRVREVRQAEKNAHVMDKALQREAEGVARLAREYKQFNPGRSSGLRLRNWMSGQQSGSGRMALAAGSAIGDQMGHGLVRRFRATADRGVAGSLRSLGQAAGGRGVHAGAAALGKLGHALEGVSTATVRLGPFTTTIRGLIGTLSVLGPTVLDVTGALGSLVGVLGAGIAGAGAVGSAAVVGLGLGFLGLKFSMRNTGQEVGQARKAINALQSATLKFGADSEKAKKKQKELNHVMSSISPLARETAKGIESFYKNWDANTGKTRGNLGRMAHDGFQALNQITPMWAKQTNALSTTLTKSLGGAFKFLGKGQGKGLLDSIMGNFNSALPTILHGLGGIGEAFLRIASAAGPGLAMLGRGLDRIGQKFNQFTKSSSFGDTMARWVGSARDLMRFFGAAGRVLMHFFGAGVDAGRGFVRTMTDGLNRWDRFLTSAQGKNSTAEFFARSVRGAEALWSAIAPIGKAFVVWAGNLSPVVTGFLQGAGALTKFLGALVQAVGLNGPLRALGFTIGALFVVGKISAAAAAITGFTRALFGMAAAEKAVAGAQAFTARSGAAAGAAAMLGGKGARRAETRAVVGAAETAGIVAAGGAAEGASRKVGILRAAATKLIPAIGGMGVIAGGLATAGLAALGGAAVYGLYKLSQMKSGADKAGEALDRNKKISGSAAASYRSMGDSLGDVGSQYARTRMSLKDAGAELKKTKVGTDAHASALLNYRDAMRQNNQARESWISGEHAYVKAAQTQAMADRNAITNAQSLARERKKSAEKSLAGRLAPDGAAATKDKAAIAQATAQLAGLSAAADRSSNRLSAAGLNAQRAYRGMPAVVNAAEQALGKLNRSAGGKQIAKKISLKYETSNDVGKVASNASKALKGGVPNRIVTRIVADSSNADQAVRRLRNVRISQKIMRVITKGGDEAVNMLQRITGKKLTAKQQRIVESGGQGALNVLQRLLGVKLPKKNQQIGEKGSSAVMGALRRILGVKLANKVFSIIARDQASGVAGQVRAIIAGIPRSVTVDVKAILRKTGSARAAGRGKLGSETAFVGEGSRWQGAKELIANAKTGRVASVMGPTLMPLSKDDYVIPTEPRHKSTGRKLLSEFAKDVGFPNFASGRAKKNKHLSNSGKASARKDARVIVGKRAAPKSYSSDNLDELAKVETAKREEDNFRDVVQRESNILDGKEPASFLVQTGEDPKTGDPIYGVDQGAISAWSASLNKMAVRFDQLLAKINATMAAVSNAIKRIGDPYSPSNPVSSVIGRSTKNMATLQGLINGETSIINKKGASNKLIDAAKERRSVYTSARNDEKATRDAATADYKLMDQERNDIGDKTRGRYAEAADAAATYRTDASATAGIAAGQLADATPKAGTPDPIDPFAALRSAGGALDAESALAAIGQGLNGGAARSIDAIKADQASNQQAIIDTGRAMLNDADPRNDAAAYDAISGAANVIAGLKDSGGSGGSGAGSGGSSDSGGSFAAQSMSLGTARQDLFNSFSGNTRAGAAMGPGNNRGAGGGAFGPNAASLGGPGAVNISQTFNQMPDPHSWSQGIAFELQAAL